jgi:hypothetical protein
LNQSRIFRYAPHQGHEKIMKAAYQGREPSKVEDSGKDEYHNAELNDGATLNLHGARAHHPLGRLDAKLALQPPEANDDRAVGQHRHDQVGVTNAEKDDEKDGLQ